MFLRLFSCSLFRILFSERLKYPLIYLGSTDFFIHIIKEISCIHHSILCGQSILNCPGNKICNCPFIIKAHFPLIRMDVHIDGMRINAKKQVYNRIPALKKSFFITGCNTPFYDFAGNHSAVYKVNLTASGRFTESRRRNIAFNLKPSLAVAYRNHITCIHIIVYPEDGIQSVSVAKG